MLAFQVSTSFWSLFGTSKDFETSSLGFFFFFVAIVLEFWTIEELFGANCRFIDKFCRNQLTCSNHVIWISFMPFICQIPLTLKMCDIIISPFFFFLRETPLKSQKIRLFELGIYKKRLNSVKMWCKTHVLSLQS